MIVALGLASGSLIKGMDVEFIDKIDGRKKWCQLKAGPNTINSEDVAPLIQKFNAVANLARTNVIDLNNSDLVLGVLYAEEVQLSQHYKIINETYPVLVGQDLWHRLTGFELFYPKLIVSLNQMIFDLETETLLLDGATKLAKEIEESGLLS